MFLDVAQWLTSRFPLFYTKGVGHGNGGFSDPESSGSGRCSAVLKESRNLGYCVLQ